MTKTDHPKKAGLEGPRQVARLTALVLLSLFTLPACGPDNRPSAAPRQASPADQAARELKEADAAFSQEDYSNALHHYNRTLEFNPQSLEAFRGRGNVRARLRDFAGALEDYEAAIRLAPQEDYLLLYLRGQVEVQLDQDEKALEDFNRAIQLKPDYPEAFCARGATLLKLQRFAEAKEDLERSKSMGYEPAKLLLEWLEKSR